jgi:rhodanese-related sulfurtransferase
VSLASPLNPSGVASSPKVLHEVVALMEERCPDAYLLLDESRRACGQLSSEAPVFVYCAYGFEVGCNVATTLRQRGFDARYVRGGLAAWCGAEGPRAG